MKNLHFLTILALLLTAGCNPIVETESVDLDAVNDTITLEITKYQNAWNAKDIDVFTELVSDDCRFFGSDPSEILDKAGLINMYAEYFAESTDFSYSVELREVMPASDGKSAIVVEHITMSGWTPKMPMRHSTHFVKVNDTWKIDFISWGFIVRNDDVQKLNEVLQ